MKLDFEIAVDQEIRTLYRTLGGVPNPGLNVLRCILDSYGHFWPNNIEFLKNAPSQAYGCSTSVSWSPEHEDIFLGEIGKIAELWRKCSAVVKVRQPKMVVLGP